MLYKNLFQLYPDNFQNNYFLLSDKLEDIRYIPPVDSYLTRHSVTNLSDPFSLYLSYIIYTLQERNYELNTRGLHACQWKCIHTI